MRAFVQSVPKRLSAWCGQWRMRLFFRVVLIMFMLQIYLALVYVGDESVGLSSIKERNYLMIGGIFTEETVYGFEIEAADVEKAPDNYVDFVDAAFVDTDTPPDADIGINVDVEIDTENDADSDAYIDTDLDTDAWMEAILDELDFSEIESYVGSEVSEKISFSDLVNALILEGWEGIDGHMIATWIFDIFFYELATAKDYFMQMLVFTAAFAIFKQILDMRSRYISEVTFLMVCAIMMTLLLNSFALIAAEAQAAITRMIAYLSVLVPVYATVLLVSGNAASAGAFYELSFLIMTLLEWAMRVVLVPGIHIFLMLSFLNELFEEAKLSKMAQLVESAVRFVMKAGVGAVVGISVIQSLLTPAQDRLTESAVLSSVSAIPGIGSLVGSAGDILLSCGMLIKNSVGVAALAVLVIISLVPIVKVFLFMLLYRLLAAIMQPVSDRRIVNCIHATSQGCELYLLLLKDGMIMFFLTVAMVTASSAFVF